MPEKTILTVYEITEANEIMDFFDEKGIPYNMEPTPEFIKQIDFMTCNHSVVTQQGAGEVKSLMEKHSISVRNIYVGETAIGGIAA